MLRRVLFRKCLSANLREIKMDVSTVQDHLAGENNAEEKDEGIVHLPGRTEDNDCDQDEVDINTEESNNQMTSKTYRIELNEPQETDEKCCSDEVVPFVLDEDFDYDNVVLTPKFTIRDLKVLPK